MDAMNVGVNKINLAPVLRELVILVIFMEENSYL